MAGIYIHIPFCKQACHYCDFHFSTNIAHKSEMVKAITQELVLRKEYLHNESIQSVYFGGGTPSLLNEMELVNILDKVRELHTIDPNAEITLEANPDDLSRQKLKELKAAGVNRLSIGIQTFDNARLKFINRAHTSRQAIQCLTDAKEAGFDNITADLIYAIPPDDVPYWENDLEQMLSFDLPHLSVYGLTIEEKTVFGNWAKKGKLKEVQEEINARQFRTAHEVLTRNGYEHYEVSNYARDERYSRHNSAYWHDQKYLGIGPGAHSYDGKNRWYNISNNPRYISSINEHVLPITIDQLTDADRANEYVFTHLRTMWGISLAEFKQKHKRDLLFDFQNPIDNFCRQGLLKIENGKLLLTFDGLMLADEISWRLFYDQD